MTHRSRLDMETLRSAIAARMGKAKPTLKELMSSDQSGLSAAKQDGQMNKNEVAEDVRGTSREEPDQFETAFQWMVEDAGGNSVFDKYEKFQTREYGRLYRNTFTEARWEGWSARAKLEAGRASLQAAPPAGKGAEEPSDKIKEMRSMLVAAYCAGQRHPEGQFVVGEATKYANKVLAAAPQGAAPIQSRGDVLEEAAQIADSMDPLQDGAIGAAIRALQGQQAAPKDERENVDRYRLAAEIGTNCRSCIGWCDCANPNIGKEVP